MTQPATPRPLVPRLVRPVAPRPFAIVAQNLPEHARNPIHTDEGAHAAGFPRGLVAGVTTYAYLTHPVVEAWGVDWLTVGGGEVRFRRPVFAGDVLRCQPTARGDDLVIDGCTGTGSDTDDDPRLTLHAVRRSAGAVALRPGEALPARRVPLAGELGSDYGERAGEHLPLYGELGIVHPAVWPAIGNYVVHRDVARGAWVHTRTVVRHHALAAAGRVADVRAVVVRRFERHGESAVLDVHIEVDGALVASLEHEAIVALP